MNIKNSILKLPFVQSLKAEKIHSQLKAEKKQKKLNYKDNRFSPDDSKASPSVSIIIYSENVSGKLDNLLHSLRDCQSYDNYEVVIATKRADEASRIQAVPDGCMAEQPFRFRRHGVVGSQRIY